MSGTQVGRAWEEGVALRRAVPTLTRALFLRCAIGEWPGALALSVLGGTPVDAFESPCRGRPRCGDRLQAKPATRPWGQRAPSLRTSGLGGGKEPFSRPSNFGVPATSPGRGLHASIGKRRLRPSGCPVPPALWPAPAPRPGLRLGPLAPCAAYRGAGHRGVHGFAPEPEAWSRARVGSSQPSRGCRGGDRRWRHVDRKACRPATI